MGTQGSVPISVLPTGKQYTLYKSYKKIDVIIVQRVKRTLN